MPQVKVVLRGGGAYDSPSFTVKRVEVDGVQIHGVHRALVIAPSEDYTKLVLTLVGNISVVNESDEEQKCYRCGHTGAHHKAEGKGYTNSGPCDEPDCDCYSMAWWPLDGSPA